MRGSGKASRAAPMREAGGTKRRRRHHSGIRGPQLSNEATKATEQRQQRQQHDRAAGCSHEQLKQQRCKRTMPAIFRLHGDTMRQRYADSDADDEPPASTTDGKRR